MKQIITEMEKVKVLADKAGLYPSKKFGYLSRNEKDRDDTWFCHRSCNPLVITNVDGWCNYFEVPITHWLEVECFDNAITK